MLLFRQLLLLFTLSATLDDVSAFRAYFLSSTRKTLHQTTHVIDGSTIEGELSPIANNVLVKVREAASETSGGLIIPENAKEKCYEGVVVAAGPGRTHPESGIKMTMGVSVGDKVIYGKYDGAELLYDDLTHQLIKDDDVLLMFTEGNEATIDNVKCLKDNILIELPPKNDKSLAGVIVKIETDEHGNTSDRPTSGEVIKVGPGREASNGKIIEMPVRAGDKCRFRNFAGSEVSISNKKYLIVKGHDIQAKW